MIMDNNTEDKKTKNKKGKLLRIGTVCLIAFVILSAAAYVGFYLLTGTSLLQCYQEAKEIAEDVTEDSFRMDGISYIYYDDGSVMAELKRGAASNYLSYDEIPEDAVNAMIAVEDRSFWTNPGYDWKSMVRAAVSLIRAGEITQGGSTITQQLCKLVFLSQERTWDRKVKEIFLAGMITEKYEKEQIMEWYLNYCCFANNIYGIQDAAEAYLGKDASELSLSEVCYLCAIPNRPEYYNPWASPENAVKRRDQILNDMREIGMITEEEYQSAVSEQIHVIPRDSSASVLMDDATTYAINCAVEVIMETEGFQFENAFDTDEAKESYQEAYREAYSVAEQRLYTGGYSVRTSLNPDVQQRLQEILDEELEDLNSDTGENGVYNLQGAITVVDNVTHKVAGITGRRSQEGLDSVNYNRAYRFYRQPGSSIKPLIVYTPALMLGYTADSIVKNVDVQEAYEAYREGEPLSELSGEYLTLQYSVTWSENGSALTLYDEVTPEKGLSYLLDMDFREIVPEDYYLSSGLGGFTYGVSTVEMASAYSTLANFGRYTKSDCIVSMKDRDHNEIYQEPEAKEVYDEYAAVEMTGLLERVISYGTASRMRWSRASDLPAAGKTGTTNSSTNGWFCGYSVPYSIAVWVGNDDNTEVDGLSGGSYPTEIWKQAMLAMTEDYESDGSENIFGWGSEPGVPGYWTVGESGANVRDGAGSDSNVLFSVSEGTRVYVVSRDEYWSEVVIDGEHYYIYSPLLE